MSGHPRGTDLAAPPAGAGPVAQVDDQGLLVRSAPPDRPGEPGDVFFGGQHVWSFTTPRHRPGAPSAQPRLVPWPRTMRPWLSGTTRLLVRVAGEVAFDADVRFGGGSEPIAFVDKDGIPVMIDKWGLVQRPFTGRGAGVVDAMVETTETILAVLEHDLGIDAWIAFGTLLGAAREGRVIGHDSDIDLAYLSTKTTPAAMAQEMYAVTRALRRHGLTVLNKSGSFVTVLFHAPDGGSASIDIYTCFYLGDLLYETATVRAPVPRSAVEPLSRIGFEGRLLPAPADPDALLTVSYGAGWRTPDPSFRHQPPAAVTDRFHGWFGSLMRHRRDWERAHRTSETPEEGARKSPPSDFARWVRPRAASLEGVQRHLVDVGCGLGGDALYFARKGWSVSAFDYARGSFRSAAERAERRSLPVRFEAMNLYDGRDAMTAAALVARTAPGPRVLYVRRLLEALDADGRAHFWRFADLVLRRHGTAYLECVTGESGRPVVRGPRLDAEALAGQVVRAGGEVVEAEELDIGPGPLPVVGGEAVAADRPGEVEGVRMTVRWTR